MKLVRKNLPTTIALFAISIFFVFAPSILMAEMKTSTEGQKGIEQEEAAQKVPDQDVLSTYETLSSLSLDQRKELLETLPAEKKSALWKHHLNRFQSKHTDLSEDQKKVIEEALALATPELFETTPDNPEWETKVAKPLDRLTKKARWYFSGAVVKNLFYLLGGAEPSVGMSQDKANALIKASYR